MEGKTPEIFLNILFLRCFRCSDEEEFKTLEKARQNAMEMAKEENAPPYETEKSQEEVMGVWGSQGSWRAPVT